MAATDSLLPLDEVTRRLQIRGQRYLGVQPIPISSVVGSVDRLATPVGDAAELTPGG